jgi:dTDP-4-amino-4,6-dideoxygalactose transaminase
VPYWNGETYRRILRSFRSLSIVEGPDIHELRSQLIEKLGVQEAILCGSGSFAIALALRACGVRQADEVVIPTFCCSAVVSPILAVGAIPVLADVGEELNLTVDTVAAVLTRKTKAIIVPHLFGNPAEIDAIVECVEGKNIRVIDDAAQALGATIDGRPVGSFGDAGILSFGAEKICFGLGGGAVLASKQDFLSQIVEIELAPPARLATLQAFLSTVILRRWRGWTFPLDDVLARKKSSGPDAPVEPYRRERMANLNAAVALTLLRSLHENIAARRDRVHAYRELLGDQEALELVTHRPSSAALVQVVRVLKKRRSVDLAAALIDALRNTGYEIQGSYLPIHRLSNRPICVWDQLPYTERVWADLIELPCEPGVSLDQVGQIAAIVKATINS